MDCMTENMFKMGGRFRFEQVRDKKVIEVFEFKNLITNSAKNYALDVLFNSNAQTGPSGWYIGLIGSAGFGAGIVATDTMSSHAGWTEATGYSETTRPAWGPGAAASQQTQNATVYVFTINTSAILKGAFLVNNSLKGGTAGQLLSAGLFTLGDATVANGDTFRGTYIIGM